ARRCHTDGQRPVTIPPRSLRTHCDLCVEVVFYIGSKPMLFCASMFFTDYSMGAGELAQALEERGFESVWAPEHSHIPVSRASAVPSGGELPKQYHAVMGPFVSLPYAAAVPKTIKIGTGVCLVAQRDPIQTAKLVASLDQVSSG